MCISNGGVPYKSPVEIGSAPASINVVGSPALTLVSNGIVSCAFGTSNTSTGFGQTGATVTPSGLGHNTGSDTINAGLDVFDEFAFSMGSFGPWTATLPGISTGDNVAQCISIIPIGD